MLAKTSHRITPLLRFSAISSHSALRSLSTVPLVVDGKPTLGNGSRYEFTAPDGTTLGDVACIKDAAEITKVCENAGKAFPAWAQVPPEEKAVIFERAAKNIHEIRDKLVDAHNKQGVPPWFSEFNVDGSIENIRHYASIIANKPSGTLPVQNPNSQSHHDIALVLRQPIGPVLSISAWNAPALLTTRSLAAPLAAGCTVVNKSSELSPDISYWIVDCFNRAGLPENVLNLVNCEAGASGEVVEQIIADKNIRIVNFTGSSKVGSAIAAEAGKHLKPILLELGGKNCSIIDSDVGDLDRALSQSLWSAWSHKGQICMSTDSLFVHESQYDTALERIKVIGNQMIQQDQDLKILQRTPRHAQKARHLIDDALSKGAQVLVGQPPAPDSGADLRPVVLTDVTPDMELYWEESFGPVVSVIRYHDTESVIKQVNSLHYGLKCSVYTANHLRGYKIASEIGSGSVHINRPTVFDEAHLPHGGYARSGYGRFNSHWGIDSFTYEKLITLDE